MDVFANEEVGRMYDALAPIELTLSPRAAYVTFMAVYAAVRCGCGNIVQRPLLEDVAREIAGALGVQDSRLLRVLEKLLAKAGIGPLPDDRQTEAAGHVCGVGAHAAADVDDVGDPNDDLRNHRVWGRKPRIRKAEGGK